MRQKIKNFMDKPITYGATCKASAIVLAIYAVIAGAWLIYKKFVLNKIENDEFEKEFDNE